MKRIDPTRTARISFPNSRTSLARGCRGFKLLEFAAVLLIASTVGVTAVSASYGSADDRRQAQRTNAQYALSEIALLQEEYFLHNKRYTRHLDSTGLGLEKTATSGGHYELRVEFPAEACPTGYCYVVSAIPQGEQAEDECGVLELTSDGAKLPAGCW